MNDTVFFVSDTHFKYHSDGKEESKKRKLFLEFLESCGEASRLYLLGDIFDFWFEYKSVIPRFYNDILSGLKSLADTGTDIYIIGGNHDHWFGSFLPDMIGITILPPEATHELQGHTVTMTHGDTLMPRDYGYKVLKAFIGNRFVVSLARLVHPDLMYTFARRFSKTSKSITNRKTRRYAETVASIAERSFFNNGNDVFVMGHIHLPVIQRFPGKMFVILGDWVDHFTYLKLENGEFSLEAFKATGKH